MMQRILGSIILTCAICKIALADSCFVQVNYSKMMFNHQVNIDSLFHRISPDSINIVILKNVKGFTQLNFNVYSKLWRLEIGFDSITKTSDWKLETHAQEVFISGIRIDNLIIGECNQLYSLQIGRSIINRSFVFHSQNSIDDFSIIDCDLTIAKLIDISNIRRVDLYNNKINVLPEFVFSPLIYRVDLSGNISKNKLDYKRLISKQGLRILLVRKKDFSIREMNELKEMAKKYNIKLI